MRRTRLTTAAVVAALAGSLFLPAPASAGPAPGPDQGSSAPTEVDPSVPSSTGSVGGGWVVEAAPVIEGAPGDGVVMTFVIVAPEVVVYDRQIWVRTADFAGTATPHADYVPMAEYVTVPAGQAATTATVDIVGDVFAEPDELVGLDIHPPGVGWSPKFRGFGTILDDDVLPPLPHIEIPKLTRRLG